MHAAFLTTLMLLCANVGTAQLYEPYVYKPDVDPPVWAGASTGVNNEFSFGDFIYNANPSQAPNQVNDLGLTDSVALYLKNGPKASGLPVLELIFGFANPATGFLPPLISGGRVYLLG